MVGVWCVATVSILAPGFAVALEAQMSGNEKTQQPWRLRLEWKSSNTRAGLVRDNTHQESL